MKLNTKDVGPAREGLIAAERRGGKTNTAFGEIERVAVPVEDGNAF